MFALSHVHGVDPWVAASTSSDYHYQVSRAAAARHAITQAVRERRNATRSARRSPTSAPVETVVARSPVAENDAAARPDELTSVG